MKKSFLSLVLALTILIGSVGNVVASNEGISVSKGHTISINEQGQKIINNMLCNYIKINDFYDIENGEVVGVNNKGNLIFAEMDYNTTPIYTGKYSEYDFQSNELKYIDYSLHKVNPTKRIKITDYNGSHYPELMRGTFYVDGKYKNMTLREFLGTQQGVYTKDSYAIYGAITNRTSAHEFILKDGRFIYGARNPRYNVNGEFSFNSPELFNNTFYYGCKDVITVKEFDSINKALNKYFRNIDRKWGDSDKRKLAYDTIIGKVKEVKEKTKSKKTIFILDYIEASANFFKNQQDKALGIETTIGDFVY